MALLTNDLLPAALRLQRYLVNNHFQEGLIGPDPGVRFNYRIGRFGKSILSWIRWNDDLCYIQGQGYWVLGNWILFDRTGDDAVRDVALRTCDYILKQQRADGAWEYPNPEWKGRLATTEGNWGTLGLLESYRRTSDSRFLEAGLKWHRFLTEITGFRQVGDELAVNYFANKGRARVVNNSITTLRVLAELAECTGDEACLEPSSGLLTFLQRAQNDTGEFPYIAREPADDKSGTMHFQCFQYNSFACLNLMRCYEVTGNCELRPMIERLLSFLSTGQADDGHSLYQCGNSRREVIYHTAVMAAAFAQATSLKIDGYDELAHRGYSYLLGVQRPDGSFPFSRREYNVLSDRRSYPRYLAMILYHLLQLKGKEKSAGVLDTEPRISAEGHHVG